MRKKLLSVLLCATMAVSMLAGCGSNETAEPTAAPTQAAEPTKEPTKAPDPTATPVPTEAPAVTAEALPEAVYYFPFEDATGLSARQNVNDATITTVDERVFPVDSEFIFTNGVKGNGLWLDGNFGAKVTGIEPINTDTYTISFWVWAARFSTYGTTLQFGNGMAVGDTEHWLSFTTPDAGKTYPQLWNRNAAQNVWPNPSYETEACYGRKSWAHIALVCDETDLIDLNGTMVLNAKLYVNGVPSENVIQIVPGLFTGSAETDWAFLLGVNPWDAIFKGCLDELYIYDEALTAGQVAALYADGDAEAVPAKSTEPEPEVIRDYSAQATSGVVVGAKDSTSTFGSEYSDIVEVPVGETVEMKFKHYIGSKLNEEGKNVYDFANTFSVILQNTATGHNTTDDASYKEYAVVSGSEGFEAQMKTSDLTVERNTFNQFNPEKFTTDMDLATIYLSVTNNGDTVDVNIKGVCADAISRYLDVVSIPVDGPVYFCLTTAGSFIEIQENMESVGFVVGATDYTTPFWTAFSDTIKVEAGETSTIRFKNYTSGAANWNNFVAILQNVPNAHSAGDDAAYVEYGVVRADNWGWGAGFDGIATKETTIADFATWLADMNGADVELSVTNNGTTADVVAVMTGKSGTVYTQKYLGIAVTGDLYYCLTVDGSWIDIGTVIGATDYTTAFWTAFSETKAVPAGESVTVKFKNYTSGAANWNNFVAILQNVPNAHSAGDDAAYVEYGVVRADNWGWGAGFDGIATKETTIADFAVWLSEMNGAEVELTVTNNGTTADVVAVMKTTAGTEYTQKYLGIAVTGDLYFCLTVDGSWICLYQ